LFLSFFHSFFLSFFLLLLLTIGPSIKMKTALTLFLLVSSSFSSCSWIGRVAGQNASSSGSSSNGTSSSTSRPKTTMAPSPAASSSSSSSSSNRGGGGGVGSGLLGRIFNATFFSNHSQVNYTSNYLICNAATAQITCSHPNQKADILANTCDIALLDLVTGQEAIGVTALNQSYNNFTLQGCLAGIGQVCFAGCYANCTCAQPDGSPCGLCSQYINNATFLNGSSPTGGGAGYGGYGSGGGSGSGSGTGGGSNTAGGAASASTSAGSRVQDVVLLSMTTLAVAAGFVGASLSGQVL
jgi:hypothetical protein